MKDYGSNPSSEDQFVRLGKVVAVPWKLVRFAVYLLCLTCLQFVNMVSSKYALGFHFRYEFEERPEWKYLDVNWRQLLKYKLRIEKK